MNRFLCLALFVLLTACGPRTIPLVINVPVGITGRTEALEVYVVGSCPADLTQPPAASLFMSSWRRGESTQPLAGTLPERFGVLVLARGTDCAVVGSRCVAASKNDARVVLDLLATIGPACSLCDAGLCMRVTPPDALAALDAGADAGTDGGVDAARTITPEERCDCLDDDIDTHVDEGCASAGGTVRWQSTFDGPGAQNFRSLTMGGDGRLYSNGWMGSGASAMCGATPMQTPAVVDPLSARTWTLGFNATSGACETVLQHEDSASAPFASVWRGERGVWMYAPGTLLEIVGGVATQRLILSPGAYFNAGHVRQTPGRVLLSYQVWGDLGIDVGVGALTRRNTAGSLVAVATVPASGLANVTSAGAMNLSGHGAWMPDGSVVTLSPNTPLAGSGACAVDAASASRIEIRSASALEGCVRAFGTDFPTADAEIQTHVAGNTLWAVRSNDTSVRAFDLTAGTSHQLDLPDSPNGLSPNVVLAPAADGTLFVGFSSRGASPTPEGDIRAGGYVIRLRSDPTGITVLGERWVSGNVVGLDVAPDGTVYVLSSLDAPATLCPRDGVVPPTFTPMGAALLLTALDFGL